MIQKTITAIATPLGPGGIGIIRISGPDAYLILKKLFIRKKTESANRRDFSKENEFASHVLYYGFILNPSLEKVIDEVLAVYMKAPKSFTREDVVEIHSHSGYVVLDRILGLVLDAGASLAEPGEFSKRAFLNGRIDLTQAEAIIDLINAPCETAAVMASRKVAGGMKRIVENISESILNLQAKCEALIEFSDEIEQNSIYSDIQMTFDKSILPEIRSLIRKQKDTSVFVERLHLSIGGIPNVGKSSLLNRLVDKETAIVSDLPGTTRDIIKEYISISGVPVVIYDTAGIHDTKDPIECMGVQKAKNQINKSDLVIWVLDGSREIKDEEEAMIARANMEKTIIAINKMDIGNEHIMSALEKSFAGKSFLRISAKSGTNIEVLKRKIFKKAMLDSNAGDGDQISPNLRQRKILETILEEAESLSSKKMPEHSLDIVSERLSRIQSVLENISGTGSQKDVYDIIFSQFCIGK